jgi:MFS superfamily sulfate permease-like transporter
MYEISSAELMISLLATLGVATVGVLAGIALAVALSLILLLVRASTPYDATLGQVPGIDGFTDTSEYPNAQIIPGLLIYRFDAALLFFNADYFKRRVQEVIVKSDKPVEHFVFDMEAINSIDITGLDALEEVRSGLAAKGIAFLVARINLKVRDRMLRAGLWERIGSQNFYTSVRSAVQSTSKR